MIDLIDLIGLIDYRGTEFQSAPTLSGCLAGGLGSILRGILLLMLVVWVVYLKKKVP